LDDRPGLGKLFPGRARRLDHPLRTPDRLLPGRACDAFLRGLDALDLHRSGIPDFKRINEELGA
jgi:phenylalanine-4-hydroxylase